MMEVSRPPEYASTTCACPVIRDVRGERRRQSLPFNGYYFACTRYVARWRPDPRRSGFHAPGFRRWTRRRTQPRAPTDVRRVRRAGTKGNDGQHGRPEDHARNVFERKGSSAAGIGVGRLRKLSSVNDGKCSVASPLLPSYLLHLARRPSLGRDPHRQPAAGAGGRRRRRAAHARSVRVTGGELRRCGGGDGGGGERAHLHKKRRCDLPPLSARPRIIIPACT